MSVIQFKIESNEFSSHQISLKLVTSNLFKAEKYKI